MIRSSIIVKFAVLLTGVGMIAAAGLFVGDPTWSMLLALVGVIIGFITPLIANPPKPRSLERDAHALASAYVCGKHNIGHVQLMEIINGQRSDVDSDKILKDYRLTYTRFDTRLKYSPQGVR